MAGRLVVFGTALWLLAMHINDVHAMGMLRRQNRRGRIARPYGKVLESSLRKDLIEQCDERWRTATLDHFTYVKASGNVDTFQQRYFLCSNYWVPPGASNGKGPGPIFFYLGNEADVTLYLNNTGLMWESAPTFGALLVFAEHRYYGKSQPYGKDVTKHMGYLSAEQAMADYAQIIMELQDEFQAHASAVIGFGGSYGGMLAAWMRMKYPHVLDGSIAASAPIWNFFGEVPPFDPGSFAQGVTYDASDLAGSASDCIDNVRDTWHVLEAYAGDTDGRDFLARSLNLCPAFKLNSFDDVMYLREWLAAAWDDMAMGNFPYPSSYILNGHGTLPAFPVRVACSYISSEEVAAHGSGAGGSAAAGYAHARGYSRGGDSSEAARSRVTLSGGMTDQGLLQAMSLAVGVFYNHSGLLSCYDPGQGSEADDNFWDFQWCAEMFMPFSKDGVKDMFWDDPFDEAAAIKGCQENWGVTPRPLWAQTEWGGRRISSASNIVFSNGLLDPWHGGGVLVDMADTLPAVIIPEGAHHLDLMFGHADDPMSVIEVRNFQRAAIAGWISDVAQQRLREQRSAERQVAAQRAGLASATAAAPNAAASAEKMTKLSFCWLHSQMRAFAGWVSNLFHSAGSSGNSWAVELEEPAAEQVDPYYVAEASQAGMQWSNGGVAGAGTEGKNLAGGGYARIGAPSMRRGRLASRHARQHAH